MKRWSRRFIRLCSGLVLAAAAPGPATAQEGLFIDGMHQAAKRIVQTRPVYDAEFQKIATVLSEMIRNYQARFGPDSLQVGLLLLDIGEAAVKRAETAGDSRQDQLQRGVRALEAGSRIVRRIVNQYEAGPLTLARGLYYLGTALKALGETREAEAALRDGLTVHWKKYNDHAYQLKFFEPLYEVTPIGPVKIRTAENWLKFAKAYGNGSDQEDATNKLAAARDMTPANIKLGDDVRARAEKLAAAGDEAGTHAALQAAFAGKSPADRRVLTARLKPSVFFIYRDPRAGSSRGWDHESRPLSAYDRVATRVYVENGLMPFITEGRNNLMDLLGHLMATYEARDVASARMLCRLIPETYTSYSGDRPPDSCSNAVSWARWHLSMGNVDSAKNLLRMAIDLGLLEGEVGPAKAAVLGARIELALLEARYGSPDDFLEVLDSIERQAAERSIPTGLRFYAGILRDDPADAELALRAAGRFDNINDFVETEVGRTREPGELLRDRLGITGRKVAGLLCRSEAANLPKVVRQVQCRRAGSEAAEPVMKPGDLAGLDLPTLLLAASPEMADILRNMPAEDIFRKIDHDVFRTARNDAEQRINRQVVETSLPSDNISKLGQSMHDVGYAQVAQAFVERKKLALARDWAATGYSSYQSMAGGATIFSAWLIEGFREKRYREGWIWLSIGRPILAEAAFSDFVPSDDKQAPQKTPAEGALPAEFDWTRTIGGLHGRMLARAALGDDAGARLDASALVAYAGLALRRQSFSRFETRDLVARVAQSGLAAAVRVLTGKEGRLDRSRSSPDFNAAFEALQLMKPSTTATTLTRLAARLSAGSPALAALARQREDLRSDWERTRAAATTGGQELGQRARKLADDLALLDTRMAREFPAYVELAGTSAVGAATVMSTLGPTRSLVGLTIAGRDLYVAAMNSDGARILRIDGGLPELQDNVRRLRESLEPRDGRYLRFRIENGRAIYRQILEPAADLLLSSARRTMVEVTDGPLDGIPLSVLPIGEDGRFVIDAIAGARLPSVSSLVLLAGIAGRQPVADPFLGIGDPALEGDPSKRRGVQQSDVFAAAGGIDLAKLRSLPRLPESATEIRRISELLGAGPDSIMLGSRATEREVRKRQLSSYRVLAFATHGLVAGEFSGVKEPGLVMTPPGEASDDDDGFLSASEIASLDLGADLVLLSACNTASASGAEGAEGLSGLSKAFFFAGARGLLVSHWSVDSDAAVSLTTRMIEARQSGQAADYPLALRDAMIRLRNEAPSEAWRHPGFWGPFEIVGG